ncbi:hypothetical protein [Rhodococcus sp. WS3]|uniref:hypothetical protein n=1 Tax=Rhodococcus sp. WS3 TaxID=2486271 RepID=UPI0016518F69|nr:hypothetical protein [Rhodococcus sp. WS3]
MSKVNVHVIGTSATGIAVSSALRKNPAVSVHKREVRDTATALTAGSNFATSWWWNRAFDCAYLLVTYLVILSILMLVGGIGAARALRGSHDEHAVLVEVSTLFGAVAVPLLSALVVGVFVAKAFRTLTYVIVVGVWGPALLVASTIGQTSSVSTMGNWWTAVDFAYPVEYVPLWIGEKGAELYNTLILLPTIGVEIVESLILVGLAALLFGVTRFFVDLAEI